MFDKNTPYNDVSESEFRFPGGYDSKHRGVCQELTDLYEKKNSDYGDSFSKEFKEFGLISAVVMLSHKMNRIKSLVKKEDHNFESLRDSLIDLANYSIQTIMEIDNADNN